MNPPPRQQIQPPKSVAYVPRPDTSNDRQAPRRPSHEQRSSWADVDGEDGDDDDGLDSPLEPPPGADYVHQPQYGQRQQFERQCSRTVQLSNLAEGTTHADITAAVRGGMLLDIFMRSHDRTAAVSFVNSADARKFLDHVRRNDLYIRNKRVRFPSCHTCANRYVNQLLRSRSSGMTGSLFFPGMLPTRSPWVPAAT